MGSKTRFFVLMSVAVIALLITGTAVALSGLTYNKTAPLSVSRTAATVTGSVQCDDADVTVRVSVTLVQSKGRQLIIGTGEETQLCPAGGGTVFWTVTASTTQGQAYQPGSATAIVGADSATDGLTVSGPIKLTS
jgi:hypothetical protein